MTYLERFELPIDKEEELLITRAAQNGGRYGYIDNPYPCGLFKEKKLQEINFERITILYGGNGSGKSTLLNLIAAKLELKRIAPHSTGELTELYVKHCKAVMGCDEDGDRYRVPNGSRIITSDDVFDYMLTVRTNNNDITDNKAIAKEEHSALKYTQTIKLRGMEDYEALRLQLLEEMARYCGCQFIIATHSPFLLALNGARIYDLDTAPVQIRNWWELENTRTYFEFFEKHRHLFVE